MEDEKIIIDLKRPEGNAFNLLALAKDLSHSNKFNWDDIYTELTSSDYNNLISVIENYFGDQIIFLGK
jgi:hypothetical protein